MNLSDDQLVYLAAVMVSAVSRGWVGSEDAARRAWMIWDAVQAQKAERLQGTGD